MPPAKAFCEGVFQKTLERLESPGIEMWAFPMLMGKEDAGGALVKMADIPSGGNSKVVYFSCDDCADEGSRVVNSGGRVSRSKMSIG